MLSLRQKVCFTVIFGTSLTVYISLFTKEKGIPYSGAKNTSLSDTISEVWQSNRTEVRPNISRIVYNESNAGVNWRLSRSERLLQNIRLPLTIYNNAFLKRNPGICKGVENILFLVMVHSATGNFERRQAFRETWANIHLFNTLNNRIIFLLGKSNNATTQRLITRENGCYGDIIQGDFIDTYYNLTHKAVLGLRWITENCAHAKFVVKVDDDVFLNIFKVLSQILTNHPFTSRTIFCDSRKNDIIHRSEHRWGVGPHIFPGMKRWPFPYCAGFFVVITADIIPELYEKARTSKFLWLDDVYVYGLLAHEIGHVTHIDIKKNTTYFEGVTSKCFKSKREKCHLLGGVVDSVANMRKFWEITLTHRKLYTNLTIRMVNNTASGSNHTCHLLL